MTKKPRPSLLPALNEILPGWFTGADVREIQGPVYIPPAGKAGGYRKELAADIARKASKDPFTQRDIQSAVIAGADVVPLMGEDVGIKETGEYWKKGDYINAAASGLGTVLGVAPVVGDVGGKLVKEGGKKLARGLGEAVEHLPNVEKTASAVVDPVAPQGLGALPSSQSLNTPRVPSAAEMAKSRIENVPLSQVRGSQSKMQWERFNKGEFGEPIVKGFGDMPVAVRREDGEYIIFDGHHRAVKAMDEGKDALPMHVIDARDYDPENAGRKSVKSDVDDDELLRELGVVDTSAPQGLGIKGYHGSPHSFAPEEGAPLGRFRDEKIGTGEGHQAFGRGHYIAEKEGTARSYKEGLTAGRDPRDDVNSIRQDWQGNSTRPITADSVSKLMQGYDNLRPFADDKAVITNIMRAINGHEPGGTVSSEAMFALKALDKQLPPAPTGHMYEVNIAADPETFLDWDKPLRDNPVMLQRFVDAHGGRDAVVAKAQEFSDLSSRVLQENSDEAKAAWEQMHKDPAVKLGEMLQQMDQPKKWTGYDPGQGVTGEKLYRAIGHENLKQAGIPGIRYLDQGSRGKLLLDGKPIASNDYVAQAAADAMGTYGSRDAAIKALGAHPGYKNTNKDAVELLRSGRLTEASGTRNYVVFDPKLVSIVKKYGLGAGALAAGLISQDQAEAMQRQGLGGEAEAAPARGAVPPRSPIAALDERVMDEAYATRSSPRDVLKRLLGLE